MQFFCFDSRVKLEALGPPGEFAGGALEVSAILLELRFETGEQGKRIGRRSGEAGEDQGEVAHSMPSFSMKPTMSSSPWPDFRLEKTKGRAPRILSLAPDAAPRPRSTRVRDLSDGKETSDTLLRRLAALKDALENLPRQARRLVRALARRENIPHLRFMAPVRIGYPPGHRKKPRLEIDRVLHECHWLARNAVAPNTS